MRMHTVIMARIFDIAIISAVRVHTAIMADILDIAIISVMTVHTEIMAGCFGHCHNICHEDAYSNHGWYF